MKKACHYYVQAIHQNHVKAKEALTAHLEMGNSEAQYALGYEYYHRKNDIDNAILWCMRAAEQKHSNALDYLLTTKFNMEQYLSIARAYNKGDSVERNLTFAVTFYKKACALGNKEAAFLLGRIYNPAVKLNDIDESSIQGIEKNAQESFDYYFLAAKQQDELALEALVNLAEYVDCDVLRLRLIELYLHVFSKPFIALRNLKQLAEKQLVKAIEQLDFFTENPEYAYLVAQLYEESKNLEKAGFYYIKIEQKPTINQYKPLAEIRLDTIFNSESTTSIELTSIAQIYFIGGNGIKADYVKAHKWFEQAGIKGCENAYYHLGNMHEKAHGVKKDTVLAAQYYQLAIDRGNPVAQKKLNHLMHSKETTTSDLIHIAQLYQNGERGIKKNWSLVLELYQIAHERQDVLATFNLGQFYLVNHGEITKDVSIAFQYYLQAAGHRHLDAIAPLERLGHEVGPEQQMALSKMYGTLFANKEKSEYWRKQATEIAQFNFKM